jgi:2-acylglycerol O-acyltransferase 2
MARGRKNRDKAVAMPPMAFHRHLLAYVTLGLLCGWYYVMLIILPMLLILAIKGSLVSGTILGIFLSLTFIPLKYEPWDDFMNSYLFEIWREYFNFTFDAKALKDKLDKNKRYIFFEFPHGIFPMAQVVSASITPQISPNRRMLPTAADAVFTFPVMRHIMAWLGTRPISKQTIAKILEEGHHCVILPGGIAEMYVTNTYEETIYLKKRYGTVKLAIQQGANIVPCFFFGNTSIFDVPGGSGKESWLSKVSRKIRASIIFFYGRHFLSVPYRHPLHVVYGEPIEVIQKNDPSNEEVAELLQKVVDAVEKIYKEQRPEWEDRPLVIL